MKSILAVSVLTFGIANASVASAQSSYEECILQCVERALVETAVREIQMACQNLFLWNYHETIRRYSSRTVDNHNVRYHNGCDRRSDQGLGDYCADEVEIIYRLPEDSTYEYRYASYDGNCPRVEVSDGPGSHFNILRCEFSHDRKQFSASIAGWTRPQEFFVRLRVERRPIEADVSSVCNCSSAVAEESG